MEADVDETASFSRTENLEDLMALHVLDDSGRELLTFSFSPLPTPYLRHQTPPLTPSCCSFWRHWQSWVQIPVSQSAQ